MECNSIEELEEYPELYLIEDSRKLQLALGLKTSGVELFKQDLVDEAFKKFSDAVKLLVILDGRGAEELTDDIKYEKKNLQLVLYNNMAGCHVLKGNWQHAIDLCNSVLNMDPNNVKALYRRGWSQLELQDYDEARTDLKRALEIDPSNQAVKQKLKIVAERVKTLNARYTKALSKMFQ